MAQKAHPLQGSRLSGDGHLRAHMPGTAQSPRSSLGGSNAAQPSNLRWASAGPSGVAVAGRSTLNTPTAVWSTVPSRASSAEAPAAQGGSGRASREYQAGAGMADQLTAAASGRSSPTTPETPSDAGTTRRPQPSPSELLAACRVPPPAVDQPWEDCSLCKNAAAMLACKPGPQDQRKQQLAQLGAAPPVCNVEGEALVGQSVPVLTLASMQAVASRVGRPTSLLLIRRLSPEDASASTSATAEAAAAAAATTGPASTTAVSAASGLPGAANGELSEAGAAMAGLRRTDTAGLEHHSGPILEPGSFRLLRVDGVAAAGGEGLSATTTDTMVEDMAVEAAIQVRTSKNI